VNARSANSPLILKAAKWAAGAPCSTYGRRRRMAADIDLKTGHYTAMQQRFVDTGDLARFLKGTAYWGLM
jgi:hypothetical protein